MSDYSSNYLECPICFLPYTDPTTFPCGHSCCLEEAKSLPKSSCPFCDCECPPPDKMAVTYAFRDAVLYISNSKVNDVEGLSTWLLPNADPTTFPCGHSCSLEEAKNLSNCPICDCDLPPPETMKVNFAFRDLMLNFGGVSGSTNVIPLQLENLSLIDDNENNDNCTSSMMNTGEDKKQKKKSNKKFTVTKDSISALYLGFVLKDKFENVDKLLALSESGNQFAKYFSCLIYWQPQTPYQDEEKAKDSAAHMMPWLINKHNQILNDKYYLFLMGMFYLINGSSLSKKFLMDSANRGYPAAQAWLGSTAKNPKEKFDWWKRVADQGYSKFQTMVGALYSSLYSRGSGVDIDNNKAFQYFRLAANQGDTKAMLFVAECYEHGVGVTVDKKEAFRYTIMSAEQNYGPSQVDVGNAYLKGEGVTKNKDEAFKYFKLAVDNGYAKAFGRLAECYNRGYGTPINKHEAFRYFKMSVDNGVAIDCCRLAEAYFNGEVVDRDVNEAVRLIKVAVNHNEPYGHCCMARAYMRGMGVEQNKFKGFCHYVKAADLDDPVALCEVGRCFMTGTGTAVDNEKAFEFFKLSARGGYANGLYNLGYCYMKGIGVAMDEHVGEKYFKIACDKYSTELNHLYAIQHQENLEDAFKRFKYVADCGYDESQYVTGNWYEFGRGVQKNMKKAVEYYTLAANQYHIQALIRLGHYYQFRNVDKSFFYFKAAAGQGDAEGQFLVSPFYLEGSGVEKDEVEGKRLLKLSATQRYPPALHIVGLCHMQGEGVEVDKKRGFIYLKLAADLGHVESQCLVSECYREGEGTAVNQEESEKYKRLAASQGYVSK